MTVATRIICAMGLTIGLASAAWAQKDVICAQGTYSTPCPKVIWCSAEKCGVGLARVDGDLDIIYSSEPKMAGTRRTPWGPAGAMSFQHLAGRVLVFEWDESAQVPHPGKDLMIKNVDYVIMAPSG